MSYLYVCRFVCFFFVVFLLFMFFFVDFFFFFFYLFHFFFFFFFFQAEDGIRDLTVTGVQTCALPIFGHGRDVLAVEAVEQRLHLLAVRLGESLLGELVRRVLVLADPLELGLDAEIGRASCRERV